MILASMVVPGGSWHGPVYVVRRVPGGTPVLVASGNAPGGATWAGVGTTVAVTTGPSSATLTGAIEAGRPNVTPPRTRISTAPRTHARRLDLVITSELVDQPW